MKESVRVVVVGDRGTGKTSLIKTLISEEFDEKVPSVLPVVVIPPEVTPEKVHVSIVDTPSRAADKQQVESEVQRADVVVLVYDVARPDTLQRVHKHWMPEFERLRVDSPVVLVGNKMDLRADAQDGDDGGGSGGSGGSRSLESEIMPLMNAHKNLETCIEASSKQLFNVAEVFYFAQKAVLHPTGPVYDVKQHKLKPAAVAALKRIFRLCDADRDGRLSDSELNDFQYSCFNVHLRAEELTGVKNVVRENVPRGLDGEGQLTLDGFLYLHTLFVIKGRAETCWTVFRRFGYNDELRLDRDEVVPALRRHDDQSVELSERGMEFLARCFSSADADKDGVLSPAELRELWSSVPEDVAFLDLLGAGASGDAKGSTTTRVPCLTPVDRDGNLPREGFLAFWAHRMLVDPESALLNMVYLGYGGEALSACKITKRRRRERRTKASSRSVFNCYVFGPISVGKSALLRGLVGMPFSGDLRPTTGRLAAARSMTLPNSPAHAQSAGGGGGGGGADVEELTRTLVLTEITDNAVDALLASEHEIEACDAALLLYDVSDAGSFAYAARLYGALKTLRPSLPCIFVGAKSDQRAVEQDWQVSPASFCEEAGLPPPVICSMKNRDTSDIYLLAATTCMRPSLYLPPSDEESALERYLWLTGKIVAAGAAAGGAYWIGRKIWRMAKAAADENGKSGGVAGGAG